jgi:hypothetical protein
MAKLAPKNQPRGNQARIAGRRLGRDGPSPNDAPGQAVLTAACCA